VEDAWDAGERNGTVLWEELKAKGYTGSSRSVYRRLATWREHPRKRGLPASLESVSRAPFEEVTKGEGRRVDAGPPGELRPEAEAQLDQITHMDGTLAQARELTHRFLDLIRDHSGEGLDNWLNDVRASTVREFLTFARSIERDKPAILAGFTLPYRTGPVEGHMNRLKLDLSGSV
jgi:transposase